MKKIFLFAAALFAAATVSADGFDYRTASMYDLPLTTIFTDLNNCTIAQTSAPVDGQVTGKNSINLTTGGIEASFSMNGVVWTYTNSTDGTTIAKQYGNYVQPNGKDRVITIPAKSGDKVIINVAADVTAAGITMTGTQEAYAGFTTGDNVYTATGSIVITTATEKPKFSAIIYGAASSVEQAFANAGINYKNNEIVNANGAQMQVYNVLGKMVANTNSNFQLANMPNGVYVVRVAGVKGALKIQK